MVASADMSHTTKFLNQVDQLSNDPKLKDIRITFDEFKKFDELRKGLRPLSLAIFSHSKANDGLLTKHDFQRAASHVRILLSMLAFLIRLMQLARKSLQNFKLF